jgi:hypothetical protein
MFGMVNHVEGESFKASTRAGRQNVQITNLAAVCQREANTNGPDSEFGLVCFHPRKPLGIHSVIELLLVSLYREVPPLPARKRYCRE